MLQGLEITVLPLSVIRESNEKLRIDSGYFSKLMLEADKKVRAYLGGYDDLGTLFSRFVKGIFDINADSYVEKGVPFLRILNLRQGVIDTSNLVMIPEGIHDLENKTELRQNDIVLSKTAYPAASMVNLDRCNTSQDTIATTLSMYGKTNYLPEAIVAYLNSSLGERLLWRQFQGNVQLHLSLDDGRKVPVPRLGKELQKKIRALFISSENLRQHSETMSQQAEQTLLRALGLDNWQPPEPLTYEGTAKDIHAAARFDAEYFNPAKRAVLSSLHAMPGKPLRERVRSIRDLFDPTRKHTSFQLRNFDLPDALHPVLDDSKEISWSDEVGSTKKFFEPGDVVISRLRSYLREIAVVQTSPEVRVVGSTEFIVLRPLKANGISAETLWAFLRSAPVQTVLKWCVDGSQHPRFREEDLLNIPVPDAVVQVAPEVDTVFRSAIAARQQARQLLEAAKRAVEIAIEGSEAAALEYLHQHHISAGQAEPGAA